MLQWVAISSSRGSSQLRIEPVSAALAGGFFTTLAIWEACVHFKEGMMCEIKSSHLPLTVYHFFFFSKQTGVMNLEFVTELKRSVDANYQFKQFLGPWNGTAAVSTQGCRAVPGEQRLPHRSIRAQPGPLGERHSGPAGESGLRAGLEPVRCGCMRLEALSCGSALSDGAVKVRLQSPVSQSNLPRCCCEYN